MNDANQERNTMPLTYAILRSRHLRPVGTETMFLSALERRVSGGPLNLPLNLTPEYQRGRVWTDDQASRFVGFLAEGGEAPPVFIQRWRDTRIDDEVVDGLQRLTAVLRFGSGEIPMETSAGERAYLREFTEEDQRILRGPAEIRLTIQYVMCDTRAQVLELYIRLNRGGTPHTESEIERVREMLDAERTP